MHTNYGKLPVALPEDELPPVKLPFWLTALAKLRIPKGLRPEILQLKRLLGNYDAAVYYNLHYELHGMACISAALPVVEDGEYRAYRKLEWSAPIRPRFRFQQLGGVRHYAEVRYTPGYVGALSGRTRHWHISMNQSPDAGDRLNPRGVPVAWVLRRALVRNGCIGNTLHWLLQCRVVRQAFVVLVSKYRAYWLVLDPYNSYIQDEARYPTALVVGNDWEERDMSRTEERAALKHSDKEYRAQDMDTLLLDEYSTRIRGEVG